MVYYWWNVCLYSWSYRYQYDKVTSGPTSSRFPLVSSLNVVRHPLVTLVVLTAASLSCVVYLEEGWVRICFHLFVDFKHLINEPNKQSYYYFISITCMVCVCCYCIGACNFSCVGITCSWNIERHLTLLGMFCIFSLIFCSNLCCIKSRLPAPMCCSSHHTEQSAIHIS